MRPKAGGHGRVLDAGAGKARILPHILPSVPASALLAGRPAGRASAAPFLEGAGEGDHHDVGLLLTELRARGSRSVEGKGR